jgi:hypothetical protein
MFDQGVLQLLCEAAKPEQLEQSVLASQVQHILESLQPQNVRRVNINSRIVREQQLLWLEEIKRDPENLLWSEEITLAKPSLLQRITQNRQHRKLDSNQISFSKASPRLLREKKVFWRGLIGGASLSLFLLLLGWAFYRWLYPQTGQLVQATKPQAASQSSPATTTAKATGSSAPNSQPTDPFAEAVRMAESTVVAGQSARTSADWLEVATRWQKASDLMGQVPAGDSRYSTAQDRVRLYQQNSEAALQQAQKGQ